MPYTLNELKNNAYFQEINNQDRVEYEAKIQKQLLQIQLSGSTANSNISTLRDENNIFISYEDPDTNLGKQGPWQEIFISNLSPKLKQNEYIDIILDRKFNEL